MSITPAQKIEVIKGFQKTETDTGSPETDTCWISNPK